MQRISGEMVAQMKTLSSESDESESYDGLMKTEDYHENKGQAPHVPLHDHETLKYLKKYQNNAEEIEKNWDEMKEDLFQEWKQLKHLQDIGMVYHKDILQESLSNWQTNVSITCLSDIMQLVQDVDDRKRYAIQGE